MSLSSTNLRVQNGRYSLKEKTAIISDKNDLSMNDMLVTKELHLLSVHHRRGQNKVIFEAIIPLILCSFCPFFVRSVVYICTHANGSLLDFFKQISTQMTLKQVLEHFFYLQWHWPSAIIFFLFISYSILMTLLLPGEKYHGPVTDYGHVPEYKDNGFSYYLISLGLFVILTAGLKVFGLTPTYIYDNFEQFLSTLNTFAFIFCLFLMLKGKYFPSTREYRSSPNWIIDFYRGVELYPRIFGVDIKLITNCRFGMLAWALLSAIFCMKAFELYGYADSSLVTCILTVVYLTKFFWWESGYMKTMDIIVDRAGFYLCWGCLVWVPALYTLPSYFLVSHRQQLGPTLTFLVLLLGFLSIYINYDADRQKLHVRRTNGNCFIWGSQPQLIRAKYRLLNGNESESLLLANGYWGISRHFHYIPELVLAFLWSCPNGFHYVLPYLYVIILFILLMHRAHRDDQKCKLKYGQYWLDYCEKVKFRVWPGIY
ncbi:unnamed protein product [Didymodactylos carnosus]|uniref:7-dehydrocholesterol reductase n=1 Tax=Didymodactylos carnosus TaxID=1234261 RepID=A0A815TIJ2_9BILA|nr:unnamed protein product [Didymodactylos carnosus]CAF1502486.1 unnamed protein product [Didymodactylos carnosus]CAF4074217.1 unnamed protein product [Didymodactylos carnosus]CAF4364038.1 unnamed protein product [Didymodactylos carnosus]